MKMTATGYQRERARLERENPKVFTVHNRMGTEKPKMETTNPTPSTPNAEQRPPIQQMASVVGQTFTIERLYSGTNSYGNYVLGFTSEGVTLGFSPNAAKDAQKLTLPSKVSIASFVGKGGKTGYKLVRA